MLPKHHHLLQLLLSEQGLMLRMLQVRRNMGKDLQDLQQLSSHQEPVHQVL